LVAFFLTHNSCFVRGATWQDAVKEAWSEYIGRSKKSTSHIRRAYSFVCISHAKTVLACHHLVFNLVPSEYV
jgi:hypothetical protein